MDCHEAGSDAVGGSVWKGLRGALSWDAHAFAAQSGAEEALGGTEAVFGFTGKSTRSPELGPPDSLVWKSAALL